MHLNPVQRLIRLESQSVTTEDSSCTLLAALHSGSPSIQRDGQSASPSSASSTCEPSTMSGQPEVQPLSLEEILMNLQTSITAIQQRATQTDANITRPNDLINTHLPPPLEEEGEDDEDDQEQPGMVPDSNHERRLTVQPNPREVHALVTNPDPAGGRPILNPDMQLLWPRWQSWKRLSQNPKR
ncbi:hypothetical protein RHMOL_Rhmol08G0165800 [Rhododendron molle]|uniref:Uncharacterized protein n=1 Tax=Rhododendron molle TaxID=49168 RepID=A0ACC0MR36_RHOML|nr:hypothetical protein RHMOL_Rhmol08G0165800 [Rhododendron molle]